MISAVLKKESAEEKIIGHAVEVVWFVHSALFWFSVLFSCSAIGKISVYVTITVDAS